MVDALGPLRVRRDCIHTAVRHPGRVRRQLIGADRPQFVD